MPAADARPGQNQVGDDANGLRTRLRAPDGATASRHRRRYRRNGANGRTRTADLLFTNLTTAGDSRRTVERGRVALSGARAFRSSELGAFDGYAFDPANIATALQGDVQIAVSDVTEPGWVIVTALLPFDFKLVRAGR